MSWTNECIQSNSFRVKQPKEVAEVLELLGFITHQKDGAIALSTSGEGGVWLDEDAEVVLSIKPFAQDGEMRNLHGIISDYTSSSSYLDNLAEEYYNCTIDNIQDHVMIVPLIEYLQDQLLDGEHIEITCAGFESKANYNFDPFGYVEVITKDKHVSSGLTNLLEELLNFD